MKSQEILPGATLRMEQALALGRQEYQHWLKFRNMWALIGIFYASKVRHESITQSK